MALTYLFSSCDVLLDTYNTSGAAATVKIKVIRTAQRITTRTFIRAHARIASVEWTSDGGKSGSGHLSHRVHVTISPQALYHWMINVEGRRRGDTVAVVVCACQMARMGIVCRMMRHACIIDIANVRMYSLMVVWYKCCIYEPHKVTV